MSDAVLDNLLRSESFIGEVRGHTFCHVPVYDIIPLNLQHLATSIRCNWNGTVKATRFISLIGNGIQLVRSKFRNNEPYLTLNQYKIRSGTKHDATARRPDVNDWWRMKWIMPYIASAAGLNRVSVGHGQPVTTSGIHAKMTCRHAIAESNLFPLSLSFEAEVTP